MIIIQSIINCFLYLLILIRKQTAATFSENASQINVLYFLGIFNEFITIVFIYIQIQFFPFILNFEHNFSIK